MVRNTILLNVAFLAIGLMIASPSGDGSGDGGFSSDFTNDGSSVTGTAESHNAGSQASDRTHDYGAPSRTHPTLDPSDPLVTAPNGLCPDAIAPCGTSGTPAPPAPPAVPAASGTPAVTLADIASFRPTPPTPTAEPNGWGIAGLDTNFLSTTEPQTVTGTLLGRPASVRFTPVGYAWAYGDGTFRTTASAGTSWARAGLQDFDPTPTSHIYVNQGAYTAQLTLGYSAAYSWDGSAFTPITGVVAVPAGAIPIRVVVESTVLVSGTCTPGSTAPGC